VGVERLWEFEAGGLVYVLLVCLTRTESKWAYMCQTVRSFAGRVVGGSGLENQACGSKGRSGGGDTLRWQGCKRGDWIAWGGGRDSRGARVLRVRRGLAVRWSFGARCRWGWLSHAWLRLGEPEWNGKRGGRPLYARGVRAESPVKGYSCRRERAGTSCWRRSRIDAELDVPQCLISNVRWEGRTMKGGWAGVGSGWRWRGLEVGGCRRLGGSG